MSLNWYLVSDWNGRQEMYTFLCFHVLNMDMVDRKNTLLTNFQSWIHMYPYHTEMTPTIGIKPIAIHTN